MKKQFTPQTRIKDVMKSPVGRDIMMTLLRQSGMKRSVLMNPIVLNSRMIGLVKLTKGMIGEELVETLCHKMNTYSKERLVQSDEVVETWWKEAVVYQIYPRSFQDSNDDGIGDINGVISRLDYLKELGITMIWLCPIYDSPNDDNGYDVRDYYSVLQEFGTMEDFERLLDEVHKRGMKLMMDMVLNHTSDEHEWFRKALADESAIQREYYFIRDSKEDGQMPNNWTSFFFGPAWEYDEDIRKWYLHLFSKKQPDLNWENPNLRHELYKILNWWIDKGVDGFRLDVINLISKAPALPDGDETIGKLTNLYGIEHYVFGPKIHQYLREMHMNAFANHDVVTVGETAGIGIDLSKYFVDETRKELNLVFNFDHLDLPGKDRFEDYEYDLNYLKEYYIDWQMNFGKSCHPTLFFNNHDNPRMISKISADLTYKDQLVKMLAMMQMTLSGTPFLYQGDEIGMTNAEFDSIDEFRDVETINRYHTYHEEMLEEEILKELRSGSRDNARTPMQWDISQHAGFSTTTPWIGVNPDYINTNAEANVKDENSIYHFYRQLIQIRKENKALIYGEFKPYRQSIKDVFCYYKTYCGKTYFVELNLSKKNVKRVTTKDTRKLIISNYDYHNAKDLLPYEANLMQIIK